LFALVYPAVGLRYDVSKDASVVGADELSPAVKPGPPSTNPSAAANSGPSALPPKGMSEKSQRHGRDGTRIESDGTTVVPGVKVLTYGDPFRPGAASPTGKWSAWVWRLCARVPWLCLFRHSLLSTLQIAVLQRELVYEPVYPWGRVLALLQIVLTSTLFALFVLALRRQFRR